MTIRKWLVAAAAAAVAIAFVGCGDGAGGGNNQPDPNAWPGGFSLASHLATLDLGETGHEAIFGTIPLVRAGGDEHVSFVVVEYAGRRALQVTVTQDWAGFDILHRHGTSRHFNFQPGDMIRIAGHVVSPATNQIGLGYGQTSVWLANWQSEAGEPFDEEFSLSAGNIGEMVSREGPDAIRVRGDQGVANSVFVITDLIVRDYGDYAVELRAEGLSAGTLDFGFVNVDDLATRTRTVTVANAGNRPTGALTVVSSAPEIFAVAPAALDSIPYPQGEATRTFTVVPYAGLTIPEGDSHLFTATVTVDGANIDAVTFNVTLTLTTLEVVAPTAVTITAPAADGALVPRGGTLPLTAALYPAGAMGTITWATSPAVTGVTFSPATGPSVTMNVADGVSPGTVNIVASSVGLTGERSVTVTLPAPTSIEITPANPAIGGFSGGTIPFTVTPTPAGTSPLVTWSIPETAGVSINPTTGVLAVAPETAAGSVVVTATSMLNAAVTATTTVTISPRLSQTLGDFISFAAGFYGGAPTPDLSAEITEGAVWANVGPLAIGEGRTVLTWAYNAGNLALRVGRGEVANPGDASGLILNAAGLNMAFQERDEIIFTVRPYRSADGTGGGVISSFTVPGGVGAGESSQLGGATPGEQAPQVITSTIPLGENQTGVRIRINNWGADGAVSHFYVDSIEINRMPEPVFQPLFTLDMEDIIPGGSNSAAITETMLPDELGVRWAGDFSASLAVDGAVRGIRLNIANPGQDALLLVGSEFGGFQVGDRITVDLRLEATGGGGASQVMMNAGGWGPLGGNPTIAVGERIEIIHTLNAANVTAITGATGAAAGNIQIRTNEPNGGSAVLVVESILVERRQ